MGQITQLHKQVNSIKKKIKETPLILRILRDFLNQKQCVDLLQITNETNQQQQKRHVHKTEKIHHGLGIR